MKILLLSLVFASAALNAVGQEAKTMQYDKNRKLLTVEASCGQCKFGLKGKKGCDLAIRIEGKSYFVDGTNINSHGDAHAEDGFCNAIRTAKVQGEVVDNRFKATYFKLVPEAGQKLKSNQ